MGLTRSERARRPICGFLIAGQDPGRSHRLTVERPCRNYRLGTTVRCWRHQGPVPLAWNASRDSAAA